LKADIGARKMMMFTVEDVVRTTVAANWTLSGKLAVIEELCPRRWDSKKVSS
jgi:hypothetical protein